VSGGAFLLGAAVCLGVGALYAVTWLLRRGHRADQPRCTATLTHGPRSSRCYLPGGHGGEHQWPPERRL
jgi:hypothetical protein